MGKKRKLRDKMEDRVPEDTPALVICVGKSCCQRSESRALVHEARAYAAEHQSRVRVEVVGCLHVCKKGPVAATYPAIKFKKKVDAERARKLIDKLEKR